MLSLNSRLSILSLTLVTALGLSACGNDDVASTEKADEVGTAEEIRKTVIDTTVTAVDKTTETAAKMAEKAEEVAADAGEAASDAMDSAGEALDDAGEAVSEAVESAGDALESKIAAPSMTSDTPPPTDSTD